jgi:AbrB family looped-hinge helix DNA binding protein
MVREKGRITLPVKVREALALQEGDKLELTVEKGAIVLRPKEIVRAKDLKGVIGPIKVDLEEVEEALGRI